MSKNSDRAEMAVLTTMMAVSIAYNTLRHPVKTYRMVVQGVPWY